MAAFFGFMKFPLNFNPTITFGGVSDIQDSDGNSQHTTYFTSETYMHAIQWV